MESNNKYHRDNHDYKYSEGRNKRNGKFANKNFPFNFRYFVPEINLEIEQNPDYIRIISYNILCDSLLPISTNMNEEDLNNYPYMLWENRKNKIIQEIKELKGDIICLQEFERDEQFIGALGKLGYDCTFKPRTGDHSEGCAIFWNHSKFTVENIYCLEFNMNGKSELKKISEVYDRDNICLFAVLSYKAYPNVSFIITNTHILFNVNRGDIKLAQVYQIINSLACLKEYYSTKYEKVNIIFCGDMNCVPNSGVYKMITEGSVNCTKLDKRRISGQNQGKLSSYNPSTLKTSMLKYVTSRFNESFNHNEGYFDNETWFNQIINVESKFDENAHLLNLTLKDKFEKETGNLNLKTKITFTSAYSEILRKTLNYFYDAEKNKHVHPFDKLSNPNEIDECEVYGIKMGFNNIEKTLNFTKNFTLEPPYSFYGKDTMFLVDYIFYNGSLTPVRTLNIPDINKIAMDIGYLPNEFFPSDHISLCADFLLLK